MLKVLVHRKALREIDALPIEDRRRVLEAIREMADDPFGGDVKPIRGVRGVFRRRVGHYRIAFTVNFEKEEVAILKIGRREEFYREL